MRAPELTECLFPFPSKQNVLYSLPMKGDPLHVKSPACGLLIWNA